MCFFASTLRWDWRFRRLEFRVQGLEVRVWFRV